MARRRVLTMAELEDNNNASDSDDNIDTVTIIPPDTVDVITDAETMDDGEVSAQHRKRPKKASIYKSADLYVPKWAKTLRKRKIFKFPLISKHFELNKAVQGRKQIELFETNLDTGKIEFILANTMKYAREHRNHDFVCDEVFLRRFFGILLLSGFHTLPSVPDYWSTKPALGIAIVKQAMTRQRFYDIKSYIHFCDNYDLDTTDKMAKVVFDSENLSQFSQQ